MKYCADTWFILKVFEKDQQGAQIIEDTKLGKARIIIPISTFAEATKKLMQGGVPYSVIELFFQGVESSEKVTLISLEKDIALEAAKIALSYNIAMLDAFVAATAKTMGCEYVLTKDTDFKPLIKGNYLKVKSW